MTKSHMVSHPGNKRRQVNFLSHLIWYLGLRGKINAISFPSIAVFFQKLQGFAQDYKTVTLESHTSQSTHSDGATSTDLRPAFNCTSSLSSTSSVMSPAVFLYRRAERQTYIGGILLGKQIFKQMIQPELVLFSLFSLFSGEVLMRFGGPIFFFFFVLQEVL